MAAKKREGGEAHEPDEPLAEDGAPTDAESVDDLDRAAAHGDLEGSPLELVAQKLRLAFERYGLTSVGLVGEPFDPAFHEAIVQLPSDEVTAQTVADVIEVGYVLGDRLVRPAKVAVAVPRG